MRHYKNRPEVHAGSMADIAFLLLIFFLITTKIPNEKGVMRGLPQKCPPNVECNIDLNERNVLRLLVNEKGELFLNDDTIEMNNLKNELKMFIDNNGDKTCTYCNGDSIITSSDNPKVAAISLSTHRKAPYATFIEVQDEITKAYYDLRMVYAEAVLQKKTTELSEEDIEKIKKAYPFVLSEAEIID
ncbi:ExbD/TolR family protein [Patiriisocius hiemis]|uniref:Biopolymer transporter ExbD n=1 Tax=Patiriisocius hiemis TaxID=3075604 RepID=A0ABU2Y9J0_9FLAO|nr:biopolymer transporter ExbD [Constantimarinum sp. W242]MDT0554851.1 biopolymer transporter ExbD [Constantimarinum sp. W242]